MRLYKVKVTSVDYCVEPEDICWQFDNDAGLDEDSDEYYDAILKEVERVKASLPQNLELDIECDPEDLDDIVCDTISEETGWLINSFSYELAN